MYQGMVAFNPAPYTLGTQNPHQAIKELVDAGAFLKFQPEVAGMTRKNLVDAAHRGNRPGKPLILLMDKKIGDIKSSIATEVDEHLVTGFNRTTVFVNEDTMPELKALAKTQVGRDLFPYMVAVCVLTSQTNWTIKKYHRCTRRQLFKRRMQFSVDIGFEEFVSGIPEVMPLRRIFRAYDLKRFYTPGTRLPKDDKDDQQVVGTPKEAHQVGAIWIGGRHIMNHKVFSPGVRYRQYANIKNAAAS